MFAALCLRLSWRALEGRLPPNVCWFGCPGTTENMVKRPRLLSATCLHGWFFLEAASGLWEVALFSEEVPFVPLSPLQHNQLEHEYYHTQYYTYIHIYTTHNIVASEKMKPYGSIMKNRLSNVTITLHECCWNTFRLLIYFFFSWLSNR